MKCACDSDQMAETSGSPRSAASCVPGTGCMIDALSDDVLLRVISFLGARQAVRTCVLSRRWRDLWRSARPINVSSEEVGGYTYFSRFVSRLLMLRDPVDLDEFRLSYGIPQHYLDSFELKVASAYANVWISHVLRRNARSIQVDGFGDKLHLEPAVFTSKCLTSLQLSDVTLLPGFFRKLQAGCTKLEHLLLEKSVIDDAEISSQTLKVLNIESCHFAFDGLVSISAPSLVSFNFSGYHKIPLPSSLESLVTAWVFIGTHGDLVHDIRQFLTSISGVVNLEVYYEGDTLKTENNLQWCPKFNNLVVLTLDESCLRANFYPLRVFLQNSPNLVKLTLQLEIGFRTYPKFTGEIEEIPFTCKHLEIVEIICIKGYSMLNSLEKLLLENGIKSNQIHIIH